MSSQLNIDQSHNSDGTYVNPVTMNNSHTNEGTTVITANSSVFHMTIYASEQRSAVPDWTPRHVNIASSSFPGGNPNPPPSNPTASPASPQASFIIAASDLQIEHSKKEEYWNWVTSEDGRRFAELLKVWFLHIEAAVTFNDLLPNTAYAAYLIFKLQSDSKGFNFSQKASVSVGGVQRNKVVCVKQGAEGTLNSAVEFPVERSDGWMELELGHFYCGDGNGDTEVVMRFFETSDHKEKKGLIVAGIEVRPIQAKPTIWQSEN